MFKNGSHIKTIVFELIGSLGDGGAETLVKDYALLLDRDLFEIYIIVLRDDINSSVAHILHKHNINIIPVYKHWNLANKFLNKLGGRIYCSHFLKRMIKNYNADVLHVHLSFLSTVARIRNSIKNVRLFYTCHNEPHVKFDSVNHSEFVAAEKLIRDNGLQMIALHDSMARELNGMFGINNTVVINNAIDIERFAKTYDTAEIRRSISIPKDAFVVGHIGRFVEQKNHEFLLNVFEEIHKKNPKAYLLLIGTGPLQQKIEDAILKKGLETSCMILSNRSDIPQLLSAMDVFCFPSFFEGLGIVLIEAQVAGKHCIVSDKVPKDAFISPNVTVLSLESSVSLWAAECFRKKGNITTWRNQDDYDMRKELKKLESIYLQNR